MNVANSKKLWTLVWNPDLEEYWESLCRNRSDFRKLRDSGFAQEKPVKRETSPFTEIWNFKARHKNLSEPLRLYLNVSPDEKRVISYKGEELLYFHSWDHDRWGRPTFQEYIDFNGIRAVNISLYQKGPAYEHANNFALKLLGKLSLKKDYETWKEFIKVIGLHGEFHRLQKGGGLENVFYDIYSSTL